MSIPYASTTISVLRPKPADLDAEPYEQDPVESSRDVVTRNVRAVLSAPRGSERRHGGESSQVSATLTADPIDLRHTDWVKDETTGEIYQVVWCSARSGLGLNHTAAGLMLTEGEVS